MTQSDKPVQDDTENDQAIEPKDDTIEDAEIVEDPPEMADGDVSDPSDDESPTDDDTVEGVAHGEATSDYVSEDSDAADSEAPDADATDSMAEPEPEPDVEPETVDTAPPEPVPAPPPAPVVVPQVRRGPGFLTLLIGGLIAGLIGYAAAFTTQFRPFAEMLGYKDPQAAVAALEQRLDEVATQADEAASAAADATASAETAGSSAADAAAKAEALANTAETAATQAGAATSGVTELTARLDDVQAAVVGLTPGVDDIPPAVVETLRSAALEDVGNLAQRVSTAEETLAGLANAAPAQAEELAALSAAVGDQSTTLTALTDQFAAIDSRLSGIADVDTNALKEALAGFQTELENLQGELEAQRTAVAEAEAKATEMQTAAAAQQRAVLAEAALARVRASVEGGGSFAGPLAEFASASDAVVPDVIRDNAEAGVMTLRQLQQSFPDAARDALDQALASEAGTGTAMDRLGKFLRSQSGARSLSEREGDDPDAVLSRAEARLGEGKLEDALTELAALNEAGQAAMAGWVANARTRLDAQAAVADMTAALGAE